METLVNTRFKEAESFINLNRKLGLKMANEYLEAYHANKMLKPITTNKELLKFLAEPFDYYKQKVKAFLKGKHEDFDIINFDFLQKMYSFSFVEPIGDKGRVDALINYLELKKGKVELCKDYAEKIHKEFELHVNDKQVLEVVGKLRSIANEVKEVFPVIKLQDHFKPNGIFRAMGIEDDGFSINRTMLENIKRRVKTA